MEHPITLYKNLLMAILQSFARKRNLTISEEDVNFTAMSFGITTWSLNDGKKRHLKPSEIAWKKGTFSRNGYNFFAISPQGCANFKKKTTEMTLTYHFNVFQLFDFFDKMWYTTKGRHIPRQLVLNLYSSDKKKTNIPLFFNIFKAEDEPYNQAILYIKQQGQFKYLKQTIIKNRYKLPKTIKTITRIYAMTSGISVSAAMRDVQENIMRQIIDKVNKQ